MYMNQWYRIEEAYEPLTRRDIERWIASIHSSGFRDYIGCHSEGCVKMRLKEASRERKARELRSDEMA